MSDSHATFQRKSIPRGGSSRAETVAMGKNGGFKESK